MIIPTVHGHPHGDTDLMGYGGNGMGASLYNNDFEDSADYDHEIYTLVKSDGTSKKADIVDMDKLLKDIDSDYMKRSIRVYVPKSFMPNKMLIVGNKRNRNMMVKADGFAFVNDLVVDTMGSSSMVR